MRTLLVKLFWAIAILLLILVGLLQYSPGTLIPLIRYAFDRGGIVMNDDLESRVPDNIATRYNLAYRDSDADALLDIYYPENQGDKPAPLPCIIWIHGGGLVAGDKYQVANYSSILAGKGFVVAAINYSLAPASHYPVPVEQTLAAIEYMRRHAGEFGIDTACIFLAGDSGGAYIALQAGNVVASPEYAAQVRINHPLEPRALAGLILYCGPYDLGPYERERDAGTFLRIMLQAYSGQKRFAQDPYFRTSAVLNYLSPQLPPMFLSVGNKDPLAAHTDALIRKAATLSLSMDTLLFAKDHKPGLPHEYQFDLNRNEAEAALERSVAFVRRQCAARKYAGVMP